MGMRTRGRRCGREYDLDRAAIVAGRWRLCPSCRGLPPGGRVDGVSDPFAPRPASAP